MATHALWHVKCLRHLPESDSKIVNRKGGMVVAYINDIEIATETVEDHMIFECLREAGFKMRVDKCDSMNSEIKYLGRVASAEDVKLDPKAVAKLRE